MVSGSRSRRNGFPKAELNLSPQEMAYVSLKDLEIKLTDSSIYQSLRVSIQWLQVGDENIQS
jgi:vacuolar protein sorting-associated protein 13A/C